MSYHLTSGHSLHMLPGNLIKSAVAPTDLPVDGFLSASEMSVWHYDPHTGSLSCSDTLYQLLPELAPIEHVDQLLALLSAADQYIFQDTFKPLPHKSHLDRQVLKRPEALAACEVCLSALASKPRLRFIARVNPPPTKVGAMAPEMRYSGVVVRSEEHTSELQSRGHLVCRLLLEKKK